MGVNVPAPSAEKPEPNDRFAAFLEKKACLSGTFFPQVR
jgi:hypothetical protein